MHAPLIHLIAGTGRRKDSGHAMMASICHAQICAQSRLLILLDLTQHWLTSIPL